MNRFAAIKAELKKMLGPDIGIGVTDPKSPGGALLPEEEPAMARAVTKRRLEFAAGRDAARQAMKDINLIPCALQMAADRSPVWPDGVLGSITHCADVCIAVVAQKGFEYGIGIDIEPNIPLDSDLEEAICTPSERAWLDTQNQERRMHLAKHVFCTKESIYKALYPLIRRQIEFHDVEIAYPSTPDSRILLTLFDQRTSLAFRLRHRIIGQNIVSFAAIDRISAKSLSSLEGAW